jgi:hypothetical protein
MTLYTNQNKYRFPFNYTAGEPDLVLWPKGSFVMIWNSIQPFLTRNKGFFACPSDTQVPWTLWWAQTWGPTYGFSPSQLQLATSYYYPGPFYLETDANGLVSPRTPRQHLITQVRYPAQKVLFTCFARGVPGGNHLPESLAWVFVDGHADIVRYKQLMPRGQNYPAGNTDWTIYGIKGRDVR